MGPTCHRGAVPGWYLSLPAFWGSAPRMRRWRRHNSILRRRWRWGRNHFLPFFHSLMIIPLEFFLPETQSFLGRSLETAWQMFFFWKNEKERQAPQQTPTSASSSGLRGHGMGVNQTWVIPLLLLIEQCAVGRRNNGNVSDLRYIPFPLSPSLPRKWIYMMMTYARSRRDFSEVCHAANHECQW